MKRFFSFLLCFILLFSFIAPIQAAENGEVLYSQTHLINSDLTVHKEVTVYSLSRSNTVTADYEQFFYDGDTLVAYIVLQATFVYDGSSVSVVSKSVTQSDTYDGWSYVQNSLTSSGGTVTLNAKLTKWIILNTSFTMTLSCDKDGNISYT